MEYHTAPNLVSISAQSADGGHTAEISWHAQWSADGYNIYRAHHSGDQFVKLNAVPIASLSYVDSMPFSDSDYYIVRSVAKAGEFMDVLCYWLAKQSRCCNGAGRRVGAASLSTAITISMMVRSLLLRYPITRNRRPDFPYSTLREENDMFSMESFVVLALTATRLIRERR